MTTSHDPAHPRPPRHGVAAGVATLLYLALAGCGAGEARNPDEGGTNEETVTSSRLFGSGVRSQAPSRRPGPGAAGNGSDAGARSGKAPSATSGDGSGSGGRARPPQDAGGPGGTVDLTDLGFTRGSPDAPIRVVEFSDFGCGYCRRFHQETFPTLQEEYIETGKVLWKYVPFVLGMFPNAVEAAMAGECAGAQDRFAAMRDRLFEDQGEWRKSSEPYALFKEYATEEGLDGRRFDRCVDERRPSDRVKANIQAGRRVGVRGTPFFVVEGFPLQGALPLSAFREIFDKMLASAEGRQPGSGSP